MGMAVTHDQGRSGIRLESCSCFGGLGDIVLMVLIIATWTPVGSTRHSQLMSGGWGVISVAGVAVRAAVLPGLTVTRKEQLRPVLNENHEDHAEEYGHTSCRVVVDERVHGLQALWDDVHQC